MAERKHTPGPWVWVESDREPTTDLVGAGSDVLSIYESHGGGHVPNLHDRKLIEAAPDMLESLEGTDALLEAMVMAIEGGLFGIAFPKTTDRIVEDIKRVREQNAKAIAKATA